MRPYSEGVRILVLGSGAREHAIVTALAGEGTHHVVAAPGNPGIDNEAEVLRLDATKPELVVSFAQDERIDLVVVGPEAPLVAGVADALRQAGVPVFGPNREAARIEGSKIFAKQVMERAGVPTGRAQLVTDPAEAERVLTEFGAPYVVKADGLAAGKGVLVTDRREAALEHAAHWLGFGPVLVEEFLSGEEVSLFCFSDGESVRALPPAQDFKRLLDGDAGPNTGGMGAYTPVPAVVERWGSERAFMREVEETIAQPVIDELRAQGIPFQGLLYCGLVLHERGVRVIEFNARFGDPETQVVLARLDQPLSDLLLASAQGTLGAMPEELEIGDRAAVTVVLAGEGYPEQSAPSGRPVTGVADAEGAIGVRVLHAATAIDAEGALVATGGRVLNVVGRAETIAAARERAYAGLSRIALEGSHFRRDIAEAAAGREADRR